MAGGDDTGIIQRSACLSSELNFSRDVSGLLDFLHYGLYSYHSIHPSPLMTRRDEHRSRHPIIVGAAGGAPGGAASARWASQPHRLRDARASRDGLAIRSRYGTRTNPRKVRHEGSRKPLAPPGAPFSLHRETENGTGLSAPLVKRMHRYALTH